MPPDLPLNVVVPLTLIFIAVVTTMGVLISLKAFYVKCPMGSALVINKSGGKTEVTFDGGLVYPIIHRAEVMDITLQKLVLEYDDDAPLFMRDMEQMRARITFFVKVWQTSEAVEQVARTIGCKRASDPKTIDSLFRAKFNEAAKTVCYGFSIDEAIGKADMIKEQILETIGAHLNGYVVDAGAVEFLGPVLDDDGKVKKLFLAG